MCQFFHIGGYSVSEPVQMTKISSMNRFQIRKCGLLICFKPFLLASLHINRFAYAGAMFVPNAVSWI